MKKPFRDLSFFRQKFIMAFIEEYPQFKDGGFISAKDLRIAVNEMQTLRVEGDRNSIISMPNWLYKDYKSCYSDKVFEIPAPQSEEDLEIYRQNLIKRNEYLNKTGYKYKKKVIKEELSEAEMSENDKQVNALFMGMSGIDIEKAKKIYEKRINSEKREKSGKKT